MEKKNTKENKNKDLKKESKIKKVKSTRKLQKSEVKKTKNKNEKNVVSFTLTEVIVITFMTAIVVCVLSGLIVYNNYGKIAEKYDSEKNNNTSLDEFITTYDHILNSYVEEINEKELINYAIQGMFDYLQDSHTGYLDDYESTALQDKLNGQYTGIGIEMVDSEEGLFITQIFEGSPADASELEVGDEIIAINGVNVVGKGGTYVANVIKNKNDEFIITVSRNGEKKDVKIKTDHVTITSVHSDIYNEDIGYLKVDTFSATTLSQLETKLESLEEKGIKSLIIDLRDNTGGYLNSAYEMADLFIEKGKIIYQLKNKEGKIETHKAKTNDKTTYDIIVLINGVSASASEIFAAALRDSYGAKLLGTTTFGKGSVQETETLSSGNVIKYTTAYWLTPLGVNIDNIGLEPDYEVIFNAETENDEQLEEAIKILKK